MFGEFFIDLGRPAPLSQRVVRVLLVIGLCAAVILIGISELNEANRVSRWHAVPCNIAGSWVASTGSGYDRQTPYHLEVTYRYTAGARHFTQTQEPDGGIDDAADAYANCQNYSLNSATVCYVNPQSGSEAVLNRTSPSTVKWFIIGSTVATAALVVLYCIPQLFFYRRRISQPPTSKRKRAAALIAGLGLLIGFGAMTAWWWVLPMVHQLDTRRWLAVPAKVVESNIIATSEGGEVSFTTYRSDIHYTYQINGKSYHSNCYNLTEGQTLFGSLRRQLCSRYPAGATVACFVDPAHSSSAVLSRHLSAGLFNGIWPMVLTLLGGAVVFTAGNEQRVSSFLKENRTICLIVCSAMVLAMIIGQLVFP